MKCHKVLFADSHASRRRIPERICSRCRTRCRAARGVCCMSPARCAPGGGPTRPGHPESSLVRSERGCRVPETCRSFGISGSNFGPTMIYNSFILFQVYFCYIARDMIFRNYRGSTRQVTFYIFAFLFFFIFVQVKQCPLQVLGFCVLYRSASYQ